METATTVLNFQDAAPKSSDAHAEPLNLVAGAPTARASHANAEIAPTAQEAPRSAPSDTFDQVVLGLKAKLDARTGKAEIHLSPPNLGAVKVSIALDNGTLTAEFQSPSNVVRDLLKTNLEKLKTVLQDQGLAVDRLAVQEPPAASGSNPRASFGSATHDGRSAGYFQQDPRSQQRSAAGDGFARLFAQAQDAPLDLVA